MLTHDDLIAIGRKWLSKPWRNAGNGGHSACSVVLTDLVTAAHETPDVIGWHSGFSTLIECKASKSDFRHDSKKFTRRYPDKGVGYYRYYLAPKGLINIEDLPEKWGLIEANEEGKTRVKQISGPWYSPNLRAEISMLLSLICRLKVDPGEHVGIRAYCPLDGKQRKATVTLGFEEAGTWQ